MPVLINLRHLEEKNLVLTGEMPVAELELEKLDPMIHVREPLRYDLQAQKLDQAVLLQGTLKLALECECVRCLKPFRYVLNLESWACHLPLEGEEKAVVNNDCVDLTPYLREDIVLAFPQHPLCEPECGGLARFLARKEPSSGVAATPPESAWAALDKLKLNE